MTSKGARWSDEELMAWADGVLADDDVLALEAGIEADPVLAARAAAMQQTRALVQTAFAARSADEAVPAALRSAVESLVEKDRARRARLAADAPSAATAPSEAGRPDSPRRRPLTSRPPSRPGWRERWSRFAGSLLSPQAMMAAVVFGVLGFIVGQSESPDARYRGTEPSAAPAGHGRDGAGEAASSVAMVSGSARSGAADAAPIPPAAPGAAPVSRDEASALARTEIAAERARPAARSASGVASARRAPAIGAAASPVVAGSGAGLPTVGATAGPALDRLLDDLASGAESTLDGTPLAMIATYRIGDRVCRDFSVALPAGERLDSVACRASDGPWRITYAAVEPMADGSFAAIAPGVPAVPTAPAVPGVPSGPTAPTVRAPPIAPTVPTVPTAAVEAYLTRLGATTPLDPAAERAVLGRR